jgi:small subunit ribosomal protein S20
LAQSRPSPAGTAHRPGPPQLPAPQKGRPPPATGAGAGNLCDPVANIKSQIKRIGTNEKRRLRNKAAKSEVKTRIKTAIYSAGAGEESAAEDLQLAVKRLDKAAARGIIHRNQAANRKSALMRQVAELAAASGAGSAASE